MALVTPVVTQAAPVRAPIACSTALLWTGPAFVGTPMTGQTTGPGKRFCAVLVRTDKGPFASMDAAVSSQLGLTAKSFCAVFLFTHEGPFASMGAQVLSQRAGVAPHFCTALIRTDTALVAALSTRFPEQMPLTHHPFLAVWTRPGHALAHTSQAGISSRFRCRQRLRSRHAVTHWYRRWLHQTPSNVRQSVGVGQQYLAVCRPAANEPVSSAVGRYPLKGPLCISTRPVTKTSAHNKRPPQSATRLQPAKGHR